MNLQRSDIDLTFSRFMPLTGVLIGGLLLTQAWGASADTGGSAAASSVQNEVARDEVARGWLKRMSDAVHGQNYQGVFVYQRGDVIDTLRLIHRADEQGGRQRVTSMSGVPREIIRDGQDVTCYLPGRGHIRKAKTPYLKPLPFILTRDPLSLEAQFEFDVIGDGRVIDHSAKIIELVPKTPYQYGYRLWIDEQTGLVLRSDLIDEEGNIRERVAFTSLDLQDSISDQDLQPGPQVQSMIKEGVAVQATTGDQNGLAVGVFPLGYHLAARTMRQIGPDQVEVEHLVLTDGLATVSIFIDHHPLREDMLEGATDTGRGYAYGAYVDGQHVTVIGEVPQAAVVRIARQYVDYLGQAR